VNLHSKLKAEIHPDRQLLLDWWNANQQEDHYEQDQNNPDQFLYKYHIGDHQPDVIPWADFHKNEYLDDARKWHNNGRPRQ